MKEYLCRKLWLLLLLYIPLSVHAQKSAAIQKLGFDFAAKEAVKLPAPIIAQLCRYLEKRDAAPMTIGGKFLYVPVYNVLNRSQRQFIDGVYIFISSVHDSGQLFINHKGTITILRAESVPEILADYSSFLKQHKIIETTQLAYLSAIAAFMQYRCKDIQELIKSGALYELKANS
jgi:hypothetical protein